MSTPDIGDFGVHLRRVSSSRSLSVTVATALWAMRRTFFVLPGYHHLTLRPCLFEIPRTLCVISGSLTWSSRFHRGFACTPSAEAQHVDVAVAFRSLSCIRNLFTLSAWICLCFYRLDIFGPRSFQAVCVLRCTQHILLRWVHVERQSRLRILGYRAWERGELKRMLCLFVASLSFLRTMSFDLFAHLGDVPALQHGSYRVYWQAVVGRLDADVDATGPTYAAHFRHVIKQVSRGYHEGVYVRARFSSSRDTYISSSSEGRPSLTDICSPRLMPFFSIAMSRTIPVLLPLGV